MSEKKLRILYITLDSLLEKRAGTVHILNTILEFERAKIDLHVIHGSGRRITEIKSKQTAVKRTRLNRLTGIYFYILRIISKKRLDAIYTRGGLRAAAFAAKIFSVPLFVEANGVLTDELEENGVSKWRRWIAKINESIAFKSANGIIAVSEPIAKRYADLYDIKKEKFLVVPNGVDPKLFRPPSIDEKIAARRKIGITDEAQVIGFIGTLWNWSKIKNFINVLPWLEPRTCMVIVGDGPIRQELECFVDKIGVSKRVHFIGWLEHCAVRDVMNAFDIGLVLVKKEHRCFPLKLAEYLANGLSVISNYAVTIPDGWGNLPMVYTKDLSSENLKVALSKAIREKPSKKQADMIRDDYSWEKIACRTISYIRAVIGRIT